MKIEESLSTASRMKKLISTREAAEAIGCTKPALSRVAVRLGLGMMVGQARVFTPREVATLKKAIRPTRGNPQGATAFGSGKSKETT